MIVAVDATFLTLLLNPNAEPRPNPKTNTATTHCQLRIEALIEKLTQQKAKIIVPTPALAEALCAAESAEQYIAPLSQLSAIEIAEFCTKAAIELAALTKDAIASGDKRAGARGEWQKIKIDRQIVAIAKVHKCQTLFTDDDAQTNFAEAIGMKVVHSWDLELPARYAQRDMLDES